MADDELQEKLDKLDKKVQEARKDSQVNQVDFDNVEEESPEAIKSARAGSEFLASVFAGAFIGFGIDWYFSTTPWGVIAFILIGFVSAVYRANAAMKGNDD